jgi:uncharacterized membrane protein HdeD (DUF308 family)
MRTASLTLVLRGALALAVGVIAVTWPDITVTAFVFLFAYAAFLAALMEAARAFRSEAAGPVLGRLLLAAVDIGAGIAALAWPGITAVVLVLLVAGWALVGGLVEIALAFTAGKVAGERALLALSGLISVALGIVLSIQPAMGATALAQVYGLFSIVSGISLVVTAVNVRNNGALVPRDAAPNLA